MHVDLDKGFPTTITLNLDSWSHIQEVDHDQHPFKCKVCNEYDHFVRSYKMKQEENQKQGNEGEQWQQQKRRRGPSK